MTAVKMKQHFLEELCRFVKRFSKYLAFFSMFVMQLDNEQKQGWALQTFLEGFSIFPNKATSGHSAKVEELKKRKSKKQALIQPLFNQQQHSDEFSSRVCRAFLSANIPLYKVEHAEIRALFKDFAGRELPHDSTLRKNDVSSEYEKILHATREDIGSHPIWLSTDETTDSCGRYMANVIIGKLSASKPGKGHLILCRELDVTNHGTIVRTVQAALRLLWPTFSDEEVNKVLALVTDAAPYMIKAGKSLKLLYPKMLNVTCLTHAMHRVAEELREKSSSVNSVILQ
ncbi:uncharacterized protein [Anabrus simplex]|uniref:uncharacterized protein n=1 Tax=Anabrus simplex TaxID=316456 RepID=UPI0035A3BC44